MKTPITDKHKSLGIEWVPIGKMERIEQKLEILKSKISYESGGDGMIWASMNWCIGLNNESPPSLDMMLDGIITTHNKTTNDSKS